MSVPTSSSGVLSSAALWLAGHYYPTAVLRLLLLVLVTAVLTASCGTTDRRGLDGAAGGLPSLTFPVTTVLTGILPDSVSVSTPTINRQVPVLISIERISGTIGDLGVYDITYPQVSGTPGDHVVNARIRSLAENDAAWFVSDVSETTDLEEEYAEEWWEDSPSELNLAGTVVHADDRLVSVRFERYWYPSGAAHGEHSTRVMTFDVVTGEEVRLGDLFRPGSRWVDSLAPAVVEAFVSAHGDMMRKTALESRAAGMEGDLSVGVVAEGIEVSFDAYLVGPGVLGSPLALVPWMAVLDVIDPDGPAGRFVQRPEG